MQASASPGEEAVGFRVLGRSGPLHQVVSLWSRVRLYFLCCLARPGQPFSGSSGLLHRTRPLESAQVFHFSLLLEAGAATGCSQGPRVLSPFPVPALFLHLPPPPGWVETCLQILIFLTFPLSKATESVSSGDFAPVLLKK